MLREAQYDVNAENAIFPLAELSRLPHRMDMTQADHIIEKCGGVAVVCQITGVDKSRVHRWRTPKERGGSGGFIPARHHPVILQGARLRGIDLTPDDFFPPVKPSK